MAYLSEDELNKMNFHKLGETVKISDKACIYEPEKISIGDYSRVDDLCILSGGIEIGKYVHLTPMCLVAGGALGVEIQDFSTLAYGVKVFSQSDDYSGETMVNSLIPSKYKNEDFARVVLERHVIVGANSTILPGVIIKEGCSVGAMSLVRKSTDSWGIYVGNPAKKIKDRKKNLLQLEKQFLQEMKNDPV